MKFLSLGYFFKLPLTHQLKSINKNPYFLKISVYFKYIIFFINKRFCGKNSSIDYIFCKQNWLQSTLNGIDIKNINSKIFF